MTSLAFYFYDKPMDIISVPITINVEDESNIIGFASDKDIINFGTAPRGSGSLKRINLTNEKDFPLFFSIKTEGNFSTWISIENNNFVLYPGEIKEVKLTASVPGNALAGKYMGNLYIIIKRHYALLR